MKLLHIPKGLKTRFNMCFEYVVPYSIPQFDKEKMTSEREQLLQKIVQHDIKAIFCDEFDIWRDLVLIRTMKKKNISAPGRIML